MGKTAPTSDDTEQDALFIDARSTRLDTKRRDALMAEMNAKVQKMQGMSGADITDILASVLSAVEASLPPAEGLFFVRKVTKMTAKREKDLVAILVKGVDSEPGEYDGFSITEAPGRETIDKDVLQSKYPSIYKEVLKQGNPYLVVRTSVREN